MSKNGYASYWNKQRIGTQKKSVRIGDYVMARGWSRLREVVAIDPRPNGDVFVYVKGLPRIYMPHHFIEIKREGTNER